MQLKRKKKKGVNILLILRELISFVVFIQAKKNCKLLAENCSERLKLFVKAVCAEDKAAASASISQAKLLTAAATKLHQSIKRFQVRTKRHAYI